ncbi:hypothetical protein F0P96_16265 [Hymenobacter busanensis]|uniref:Uncharacterized protein n=1 Tax=Hymenobacter busanensis TaxID=2607656 RepID=A0A7L4ZTK3_9BACT|nr:hypothetical protein [Hymenobacter busanensis]KAA9327536.1 hypothetical protein F0P96_16265 [Hymenobacter busanensis]QHJ06126.1 hypothetical protein GUY19_01970 [Hymenobacter busanensis]
MDALKIKNTSGLELVVTTDEPGDYGSVGGTDDLPWWSNNDPLWNDYLMATTAEYRPHLELIKRAIEELGWVGETADRKANDWYFVFSDGVAFGYTWREWGALMSAIVGRQEGYLAYYMDHKKSE